MSRLEDVADADGWRCWICDGTVDPEMSVNDPRGPSIDGLTTKSKSKGKSFGAGTERLAHRGCNTKKGAVAPVIAWREGLFVADPAPILASVERLQRKGGREVMGRCPSLVDAEDAAGWLIDRLSRLAPDLAARVEIEPGGGQFLLVLRA